LELLDGLPLAIAQAGVFLQESGTGIKAYIGFCERQWSDLMKSTHLTDAPLQDYPERSVWTTWAISYQAIYEKHEHTAKLLLLWSFLDNKNLWYGLFKEACSKSKVAARMLSKWIGKIASSELAFSHAMQLLRNYSLVEEVKETTGYATHPVVHRWAYHYQRKQYKLELSQLAVIVVGFAAPEKTRQDYSTLQQQLVPHAHVCSRWILKEEEEQGNEITDGYKQSEVSEIGLEGTEKREALLDAIESLSSLYADQSKLAEAEQMYKQTLQGKKEAFGSTHPSTLDTINNLGVLYQKQDKLSEAEQMYKQALQGYKETLGDIQIRTYGPALDVMHNMGALYARQKEYTRAQEAYTDALTGYQAISGPYHSICLKISARIDKIATYLPAKSEESVSQLSTGPGIAGSSNENHTDVNDTSQDVNDKNGKKNLGTRFRRLADKFR
jgi:tetratricopeptide (TPR) repeat protein